jgi:hypothetical protein
MTAEQTKQFIQDKEWVSIAIELRPVKDRTGTGNIKPFYVSRIFKFSPNDKFECTVINYADAGGKIPLVKIVIKGHNEWKGDHSIAKGAQNVDYIADKAYEITPLHQGFADNVNLTPGNGLNRWEVNVMQDIKGKAFPAFGLLEGQIYVDYDLIYICNDMLFMGSKHVDGRAFDTPENRPTNLQIPLIWQQ